MSWFWFAWQITFAVSVIYLSAHLPAPGISIGVLGLLAVVATFERDPSSLQRSIWIVIATGLLVTEINVINMDRLENQGEQAEARAVDQTRFTKTAHALQTAIEDEETQTNNEQSQFKKEQIQFDKTLARFNDLVSTETGGDAFFYLTFTELYGGRTFDVKAVRERQYPIRGAWAIIIDTVKGNKFINDHPATRPRTREEGARLMAEEQQVSQTQMNIGDFATVTKSLGSYPMTAPESDFQQYIVSLGANNGNWVEEILMKKLPGPYPGEPPNPQHHHWSQATTVTGDGIKTPFTRIDPDYPLGRDGKPMH
jgi:hypothetical protein